MQIPLVLLPGMMCDARLFAPQIAALSAGRTVVCADLSRDDSVERMAARVLTEAPPVFALAGLSMGGIVAMEVLRQSPERVAKLALLDTNPLDEAEDVRSGRAGQIERARAGDLGAMMDDIFIPRYLAAPDAEIEDVCRDMALALGAEVFARQSVALRDRPNQCDTLTGAILPTLILNGTEDQLCPPERHTLMHALMPHATRVEIAGAGHLPTLERPNEATEALKLWLQ